jgi:aryl-alcohol dehydrogenase (NADP+)
MMFGSMGNRDHDECVKIIHKALDSGVNFIDTADFYSMGESEQIVGKAIQDRRDKVVVATKFFAPMGGADPNMMGGSRRWIMQEVENSLRRLNTDYIDLYQIHRYDDNTDLEETMSALTDLIRQGKVRNIGSSMFPVDRIVEAQWIAERRGFERFRCEQPWYSIFSREIERFVLPVCRRYGMGAITYSPLDGGWLTGRYRKPEDFTDSSRVVLFELFQGRQFDPEAERIKRKLALVEDLTGIAREADLSLLQMSIAFSLEHPDVTSTIIGPRTMQQMDDLLACADLRLDKKTLDAIDALIPAGTNVNPIDSMSMPSGMRKRNRRRTRG